MDVWSIFAIVVALVGIVGSFVPVLPGPPISWIGFLLLYFSNTVDSPVSLSGLVVCGIVATVITIMDFVLPSKVVKLFGGHKAAEWGALIGMILGIILTPIGMLLGSFLGALIAELIFENTGFGQSLKAASGAFLAFIMGVGIKLFFGVTVMFLIIMHIFF